METVFLGRCDSYRQEEVDHAVHRMFLAFGGGSHLFRPGETIFLKVNLLMKKKPEAAVTTHPAVVEAVAKELMQAGCRVVIGDSPGGPFTPLWLKGIYKSTGMEEVAAKTGCALNYDVETITVPVEDGSLVKSLTLSRAMWSADGLISLGKLKTHGMTVFTGAVKNLFGVIPGLMKAEYHLKMPGQEEFCQLLVDICQKIKPRFSLIDGIMGMEGEGPSSGTPRPVKALVGSVSPYGADWVGAKLIGLNMDRVPTLVVAQKRGLTDGQVNIVGDALDHLKILDFKIPSTRNIHFYRGKFPKWMERYLDNWLTPRPLFQHDLCSGCEVCKNSCPPSVITMEKGRPKADLDKCIRCFCCQELCPAHAVRIKRSWLFTKIFN
ncbi:DUF362 domain-containing protein [Candidatus Formimonas warabiya]|uniref:Ferredoxin n=1 Tax=Formimonas warabiya TaxID=1761012 RepID=A0A3G1KRP8_FORW1|nr:DUF362 domain-containing protein [Candidatus Formimonas warabiya]ATW25128.1 hypothetical protein DCMF_10415 [Candidatus Formimonas warabiya]